MADNTDYLTEQQKLNYRREMAKQLASTKQDSGGMVDGWYVKPSKAAVLSTVLQQALGGYMNGKLDGEQDKLNTKDRELFNKSINELLNPDSERARLTANEQAPLPTADLDKFIANNQGAWNADPNAAQSGAVAPQQVETRDLPPVGNLPAPTNVQQDPRAVAALQAPQGIVETPPSGDPLGRAIAQPGPDMQGVNPSQEQVAAAQTRQNGVMARALEAQRLQAMEGLGRTRDGAPLARALQTRQLENSLSPKWTTQTLKNPDGSERLIQVNQSGQTRTLDAGTNGGERPTDKLAREKFDFERKQYEKKEEDERKTLANTAETQLAQVGNARKQISDLLNPPKGQASIRDANGVMGKVGAGVTALTGIATDSADARERIEGLKGSLMATFMSNTKALAGTAAGMSEKESSAGAASIGAISSNMSTEALEKSLRDIDRVFSDQQERIRKHAASMGAAPSAPALNDQQRAAYSSIFGAK